LTKEALVEMGINSSLAHVKILGRIEDLEEEKKK
jgi:hypothetical protein